MAPKVPAEIDLFTIPHSRMKELVNKYTFKVQDVDYRNCQEVCTLLKELQTTLNEFKSHESIENMLIMDELKNRLKQRHIYNSAVCDCHNDNRLQEMLTLVKSGKHLWKTSIGERIHYGHELQKAFNEFVQQFLPHMEEEENIFQPLLVEHFEYDELRILKELVLEQHELIKDPLYQEKADTPETDAIIKDFRDVDLDSLSLTNLYREVEEIDLLDNKSVSLDDNIICTYSENYQHDLENNLGILNLPYEIMVKIFLYLLPPDRGRSAQVCSVWNEIIYSTPLWKDLYPIQWARGIWTLDDVNLNFSMLDEITRNQSIKRDEDADVDESENTLDLIPQREHDMFTSLITYVLPKVGLGVDKIILDGGRGVNSRLIHQVLLLCPNVTYISAVYTSFDYYTLKGLYLFGGLRKLRYLNLEGCQYMDDNALVSLANCLISSELRVKSSCQRNFSNEMCLKGTCNDYSRNCCGCSSRNSVTFKEFQEINVDSDTEIEELYNPTGNEWYYEPSLEDINLSGCWQVTNEGLIALLNSGSLKNITRLNLSSCFNLSGEALLTIARNCIKLQPENLTYCTNIDNGPYNSQASGCDSIDHPLKYCCRSFYQN